MTPSAVAGTTLTLFSAVAFSVVAYPEVAVRIHESLGRPGEDGASLGYYRDFYILPVALSFLVVSAAAIALAARRGRSALAIVTAGAWIALLGGLIGSVEWYYATAPPASELGSLIR